MKHLKYFLIAFSSMLLFCCDADDDSIMTDDDSIMTDEELVVIIEEMPEPNSFLATMLAPEGEGSAVFSLVTESHQDAFGIDQSGVITVKTNTLFNYESTQVLNAVFNATRGEVVEELRLRVELTDYEEQYQRFVGIGYVGSDYLVTRLTKENGKIINFREGTPEYATGYRLRYDANNRLSGFDYYEAIDGFASRNHEFTYNESNQIISIYYTYDSSYGGAPEPITRTLEYNGNDILYYNEDGSLYQTITVDDLGRIVLEDLESSGTRYTYTYDGGNLTSIDKNGTIEDRVYSEMINPFNDAMFEPIYEGLKYSQGWGVFSGIEASTFSVKNYQTKSLPDYIFNKNDYPILRFDDPEFGDTYFVYE